jgi:FlaG/FlaF family flagellin (archaellin)
MRKLSILALCLVIVLASCQKASVAPSSTSSSTNSNSSALVSTNTKLLCGHTWMYLRYYVGYVDSANKGTLEYRRGGSHNTITLDNTRVTYYTDGTATQIDEYGNNIPCTWHFTDAGETEIVTSNSTGDYYATIVKLTNNQFNWYYTDIYGVKRYGEYIPDTSAATLSINTRLITAHTWMYYRYYVGYVDSTNKGTLEYKRGGTNNLITLDNTRVTYFKNGTATQIDENGNVIPCTWHFTNSAETEMVTSNYTGDYYTTILRLDRYHFNWVYTDIYGVQRYGEYIPAH